MYKIAKAFKALGLLLRKPYLMNLLIDSEDNKKEYVAKKFGLPNGLPTVDISYFVDIEEKIEPYSFLDGSSLPSDFALLRSICRKNHVEDYLEIGTWRGESVANVAPLVKNCYSINLPDEQMRNAGLDEAYIGMHRFFSKDLTNVTHIQANSQTFDFSSLNKKFDLIFLDGDHHTEAIINDTKNAFNLLKDEHSVIVWHDYGLSTEIPRFNVLAGILNGCPPEKIKKLYHVSNTLCAIYTGKTIHSATILPNTPPSKYFALTLKTISNKNH